MLTDVKVKKQNFLQVPNYRLKYSLQGHIRTISSLKFNSDGALLASGSADKTIRIWNTADGKIEKLIPGHPLGINDIAWSIDSSYMVSCADDKNLKVWDVHNVSRFHL